MKNKHLSITILFASMLITIFMAYIIPSRPINDWQKIFGFPFGWFTVFYDTIGRTIVSSTLVNPLPFIGNVVVYYAVISLIKNICSKYKERNICPKH